MSNGLVDSDAAAFISAAALTDPTHIRAINTLVKSAKSNGWWDLCNVIYPFIGGTAHSHKFNLKDPRDMDEAYRLIFTTGFTHDSNGTTSNGDTSTKADTFFNTSTFSSYNNCHLSVYWSTTITTSGYFIGTTSVGDGYSISYSSGVTSIYSQLNNTNRSAIFPINGSGKMVTITRQSDGEVIARFSRKSKASLTGTEPDGVQTSLPISLFNRYNEGGPLAVNIRFSTIGSRLNDEKQGFMYDDIQTFQTTLGRQV